MCSIFLLKSLVKSKENRLKSTFKLLTDSRGLMLFPVVGRYVYLAKGVKIRDFLKAELRIYLCKKYMGPGRGGGGGGAGCY